MFLYVHRSNKHYHFTNRAPVSFPQVILNEIKLSLFGLPVSPLECSWSDSFLWSILRVSMHLPLARHIVFHWLFYLDYQILKCSWVSCFLVEQCEGEVEVFSNILNKVWWLIQPRAHPLFSFSGQLCYFAPFSFSVENGHNEVVQYRNKIKTYLTAVIVSIYLHIFKTTQKDSLVLFCKPFHFYFLQHLDQLSVEAWMFSSPNQSTQNNTVSSHSSPYSQSPDASLLNTLHYQVHHRRWTNEMSDLCVNPSSTGEGWNSINVFFLWNDFSY